MLPEVAIAQIIHEVQQTESLHLSPDSREAIKRLVYEAVAGEVGIRMQEIEMRMNGYKESAADWMNQYLNSMGKGENDERCTKVEESHV